MTSNDHAPQSVIPVVLHNAGNAGCTLISRSFARQLGLVDMHGNPTQAYSRKIRVQGVVAGAFEMIKTLNLTYEIKGEAHATERTSMI